MQHPCASHAATLLPYGWVNLSHATLSPPQLVVPLGNKLGPKTCLYPGPEFASTIKKLWRRNYSAGSDIGLGPPLT